MNQLLSKSLAQIVTEQYETASVFEQFHLDYCCNGKRSLQEACEENHISSEEVLGALQNVYGVKPNKLDFDQIKLSDLVDYIVYTHHSYIRKEMPAILMSLEKVASSHGQQHNELYKISELFVDLSNEMTRHIYQEETVLFPRIKLLEQYGYEPVPFDIKHFQYLELPIIDLRDDHEDAGNIMSEIRKLSNNYVPPENSCTTYNLLFKRLKAFEIDLHHHVYLENSILFPKALDLEKEIHIKSLN
jgi:regulator of cell morphogenesis and NO signaling